MADSRIDAPKIRWVSDSGIGLARVGHPQQMAHGLVGPGAPVGRRRPAVRSSTVVVHQAIVDPAG